MPLQLPEYPGRGVAVLRDADGEQWWMYFLTGRSEASRDRVLVMADDRVLVAPTDEAGQADPLRHYACVRAAPGAIIVGNGDHVDAIAEALATDRNLDDVIDGIDPEPDSPINTPRIAMVLGSERISVLSVRAKDGTTERNLEHTRLAVGGGVMLHTYGGDVEPVTTDARPRSTIVTSSADELADEVWNALRPELRVALAIGRADAVEPVRVLSRFDP